MSDVVDNLSLSVYAFGYGARFVKDDRVGAQEAQAMSLMDVVHVALKHGLGGVEVPVDKYFRIHPARVWAHFWIFAVRQVFVSSLRSRSSRRSISMPLHRWLVPEDSTSFG